MKLSCKGCKERKVGCHATCESYNAWIEEKHAADQALAHDAWIEKNVKPLKFVTKGRRRK